MFYKTLKLVEEIKNECNKKTKFNIIHILTSIKISLPTPLSPIAASLPSRSSSYRSRGARGVLVPRPGPPRIPRPLPGPGGRPGPWTVHTWGRHLHDNQQPGHLVAHALGAHVYQTKLNQWLSICEGWLLAWLGLRGVEGGLAVGAQRLGALWFICEIYFCERHVYCILWKRVFEQYVYIIWYFPRRRGMEYRCMRKVM